MRRFVVAAAATIALSVGTAAGAVAFINGSFEDGAYTGAQFDTLAAGDTALTGWTILPDGIDWIGSLWQASDGNRSLDLSAANSGGIMQTLTGFTAGKQYRITFDLSGNPDGGNSLKGLMVSATGGGVANYFYDTAAEGNMPADMRYKTFTYVFTASGPIQDVQFRSLENNPYGTVLDNVSISLVPEPATWGLMVAGFGLVGLAARRRSRAKAFLA